MIPLSDEDFVRKIKQDFPSLRFKNEKKFAFKPPRTIMIGPAQTNFQLLLLHEIAHAVLKHQTFKTDVERLKMESQAWEKASELAKTYGVKFNEDFVQDELDSYRDWLHQKSRCPRCGLTRFETPDGQYHCPKCDDF